MPLILGPLFIRVANLSRGSLKLRFDSYVVDWTSRIHRKLLERASKSVTYSFPSLPISDQWELLLKN